MSQVAYDFLAFVGVGAGVIGMGGAGLPSIVAISDTVSACFSRQPLDVLARVYLYLPTK